MDLITLLSDNGIVLRKKASTQGGEYAGPCPFCAGSDRFRVWPRKGERGRWWCRMCNRVGDDIALLRDWKGMSYKGACEALGINARLPLHRDVSASMPAALPALSQYRDPPALWKEKASDFLNRSINVLWSDQQKHRREWLLSERGLQPDTIHEARLGLVIKDACISREAWGLPTEVNTETKRKKNIWIPEGLVIPCFSDGELCRLRIRRFYFVNSNRYMVVSGSGSRPLVMGLSKNVIAIVESELDGLLVWQEAGEMAGVVALGSARMKPDQALDDRLRQAAGILGCLDYDEAGARGSWEFWARRYKNFKRWPCPVGKDPGEAFQKGVNLKAWIRTGLPWDPTRQDRF